MGSSHLREFSDRELALIEEALDEMLSEYKSHCYYRPEDLVEDEVDFIEKTLWYVRTGKFESFE